MIGHPKVLEALRKLLKYELTVINQSFLHARMCLDWGYEGIAGRIRKDSIANRMFAIESLRIRPARTQSRTCGSLNS